MGIFDKLYCVDLATILITWLVLCALTALLIEWFERKVRANVQSNKDKQHEWKVRQLKGKINSLEKEKQWLRNYIKELEFGDEETDGDSDETN